MKNLFNEDDFNSLFESAVIDSEGKGPKNNTKTPDVGATKGMQSDFDSMFDELFNDLGDDQSKPVGKQDDTGAAGGSVDPEPTDNGKGGLTPPTKSEWDSLFETGEVDEKKDDDGSTADDGSVAEPKLDCGKKCKKNGGKKLKSDFEALFEDGDDDDADDDGANVDPSAATSVADPEAATEVDSAADEFADLMSDLEGLELTGF